MPEMTSFAVDELDPIDSYKLTTGLIVPRPIGWIGTYGSTGVPNLAPYSFFQAVATNPPVLLFSSGVGGGVKDSLANARSSGVFTASLVDHDLSAAMNESAAAVGPDVDEFELAGLTAKEFGSVKAPGVAEAKAVFECTVIKEVTLGNEPSPNVVTFGEVVMLHVASEVLDGTRVNAEGLDAIGRLSGSEYSSTRERFELKRPS